MGDDGAPDGAYAGANGEDALNSGDLTAPTSAGGTFFDAAAVPSC